MKTTKLTFLSSDQKTTIRAWLKEPNSVASGRLLPRAIIQIVHGEAEYSERYEEFTQYLVDRGFVVCGHDHIGHGLSVDDPEELGYIPGVEGAGILIEDTRHLQLLIQPRYLRSVPYVMFGHAMGSFIVRTFVCYYSDSVDAAVLTGTTQPYVFSLIPAIATLNRIIKREGQQAVSELLYESVGFGSYARRMKDRRTDFDWLCSDPEVVDAYIADPLCGFMLTNGAYLARITLMRNALTEETHGNTPSRVRVLCLAGAKDPVSSDGKALAAMTKAYSKVHKVNLEAFVFPDMRHEVLHELDKKKVMAAIVDWMERRLGV